MAKRWEVDVHMPILEDIVRRRMLGREYKRGRLEGELKIIRVQIEKRFGPMPDWAEQGLRGNRAGQQIHFGE